jgi:hypothetical protein
VVLPFDPRCVFSSTRSSVAGTSTQARAFQVSRTVANTMVPKITPISRKGSENSSARPLPDPAVSEDPDMRAS